MEEVVPAPVLGTQTGSLLLRVTEKRKFLYAIMSNGR
jgi:hypothetical protein